MFGMFGRFGMFTLVGMKGSPLAIFDGARLRSTKFFIAFLASQDTYTNRLKNITDQYCNVIDKYFFIWFTPTLVYFHNVHFVRTVFIYLQNITRKN
jgi:hypothetical protein